MSEVQIEAFMSENECSGDAALFGILNEIEQEFGDKVGIAVYKGSNQLSEEYNISATPAVVIGELTRIVGFCPSKETVISALREAGLE